MTLEEALIDVGLEPLVKSPYSKAIVAVVNATLNDPSKTVTLMQTGSSVLTLIYQLPDKAVMAMLLAKDLAGVRDKDYYRTVVLGFSALIAIFAVVLTLSMLMGTPDVNHASAGLLEKIITGIFDVIKAIVLGKDDAPSP